jgi:hypothetical protein
VFARARPRQHAAGECPRRAPAVPGKVIGGPRVLRTDTSAKACPSREAIDRQMAWGFAAVARYFGHVV